MNSEFAPRQVHRQSLPVRLTHWLMAFAVICHDRQRLAHLQRLADLRFPLPGMAVTLGGDVEVALTWHNDPGVASAIAWHFAGDVAAGAQLPAVRCCGACCRRISAAISCRSGRARFWRDFIAAARFRLEHRLGEYNAVQKVFYWGVLALVLLMLVSGIAIWKPVQTYPLELLFGGFQGARIVHFLGMAGIWRLPAGASRAGGAGAEDTFVAWCSAASPRPAHRRSAHGAVAMSTLQRRGAGLAARLSLRRAGRC